MHGNVKLCRFSNGQFLLRKRSEQFMLETTIPVHVNASDTFIVFNKDSLLVLLQMLQDILSVKCVNLL